MEYCQSGICSFDQACITNRTQTQRLNILHIHIHIVQSTWYHFTHLWNQSRYSTSIIRSGTLDSMSKLCYSWAQLHFFWFFFFFFFNLWSSFILIRKSINNLQSHQLWCYQTRWQRRLCSSWWRWWWFHFRHLWFRAWNNLLACKQNIYIINCKLLKEWQRRVRIAFSFHVLVFVCLILWQSLSFYMTSPQAPISFSH